MNRFLRSGIVVIIFLLVVSCSAPVPITTTISPLSTSQQSPLVSATAPGGLAPQLDAPMPSLAKASISGVLYTLSSEIIPETMFYLTPATGPNKRQMPPVLIGPQDSNGDVRGRTDKQGQFTLNDIPPGNYFLIVWSPYNWPEADVSPTDHTPRLIELKENQRESLGPLYVSWP